MSSLKGNDEAKLQRLVYFQRQKQLSKISPVLFRLLIYSIYLLQKMFAFYDINL